MIPDPSRRDRMVAMHNRGLSNAEIAREFGLNTPAVRMALLRAGVISSRSTGWTKSPEATAKTAAQKASLAEHRADGGSLASWARSSDVKESWARQLWRKIRDDLGAQAV
jgi:hypothetical protein